MIPSLSIGPRTLLNDCNHSAAAIFWRSAIARRVCNIDAACLHSLTGPRSTLMSPAPGPCRNSGAMSTRRPRHAACYRRPRRRRHWRCRRRPLLLPPPPHPPPRATAVAPATSRRTPAARSRRGFGDSCGATTATAVVVAAAEAKCAAAAAAAPAGRLSSAGVWRRLPRPLPPLAEAETRPPPIYVVAEAVLSPRAGPPAATGGLCASRLDGACPPAPADRAGRRGRCSGAVDL